MILIMICMFTVIGKMVIILIMILKIFLVPTLKMDDMESSKLGDDRIASPLPISYVIVDNSFASNNKDNMFTNIVASNDNALLCYDDVITPIYGDCKDTYDIRRNYPY